MPKRSFIYLGMIWLIGHQAVSVSAQEPVHTDLQNQVQGQVQESVFTLVDVIDVAPAFQELADTLCTMEFLEEWIIDPEKHTLQKYVLDQDSSCIALIKTLPERMGKINLRNLSYEFVLLDPHLIASGNTAFPEPDSMDQATRRLQAKLIELIEELSRTASQYPLEDQLLSVLFHEDWSLDVETRVITKTVWGLTPIIWQRRQTVSGESINDGDTGLPVYFKLQLENIRLRNP
jgi:hypothetical protein